MSKLGEPPFIVRLLMQEPLCLRSQTSTGMTSLASSWQRRHSKRALFSQSNFHTSSQVRERTRERELILAACLLHCASSCLVMLIFVFLLSHRKEKAMERNSTLWGKSVTTHCVGFLMVTCEDEINNEQ